MLVFRTVHNKYNIKSVKTHNKYTWVKSKIESNKIGQNSVILIVNI